jgi:uncharacterized protein (TIGR04255 family)
LFYIIFIKNPKQIYMQQNSSTVTRTYLHPPIAEAAIEIRISNPLSAKDLEKIVTKLKKLYPNSHSINGLDINLGPNAAVVNQTQTGFRLVSDDQADIVILYPQSLVVARLAPYPGWSAIQDRVVSAWKIWKIVAKTRTISRVGIRYINRIDIPVDDTGKIEIEDYLTLYPTAPDLSDAPMSHYLIQFTKPTSLHLWSTTITSTIQPSPLVKTLSLLLDIDVFRTEDIPLNDDNLWLMLAEARNLKNDIFHQCITSKAAELFN